MGEINTKLAKLVRSHIDFSPERPLIWEESINMHGRYPRMIERVEKGQSPELTQEEEHKAFLRHLVLSGHLESVVVFAEFLAEGTDKSGS